MSVECCRHAKLNGYGEPHFPQGIDDLNRLLESRNLPPLILRHAVQTVPGFEKLLKPVTRDQYQWSMSPLFIVISGEVLVAIPQLEDTKQADGVTSARSIACYVRGSVQDADVEYLLKLLRLVLERLPQSS